MAKQDEKEYYSRLGRDGQLYADGKPFTDVQCGQLLVEHRPDHCPAPSAACASTGCGCGTGWTSEFLSRAGYAVTGMDIAMDMVRAANRQRTLPNLTFLVGDFENMPFAGKFDVVVSFGALHHCDNLTLALSGCKRALQTNGMLLLMEPGEGHSESETSRKYAKEYGLTERSLPPKLLRTTLCSLGYHDVKTFPGSDCFRPRYRRLLYKIAGSTDWPFSWLDADLPTHCNG